MVSHVLFESLLSLSGVLVGIGSFEVLWESAAEGTFAEYLGIRVDALFNKVFNLELGVLALGVSSHVFRVPKEGGFLALRDTQPALPAPCMVFPHVRDPAVIRLSGPERVGATVPHTEIGLEVPRDVLSFKNKSLDHIDNGGMGNGLTSTAIQPLPSPGYRDNSMGK